MVCIAASRWIIRLRLAGPAMYHFIIEQNITDFVHRVQEAESAAERDVLRRLLIAEMEQYESAAEQLEAIDSWIFKFKDHIRTREALADHSAEERASDTADVRIVSGLRELLQLLGERHRSLRERDATR